jgi:hypothetical protein
MTSRTDKKTDAVDDELRFDRLVDGELSPDEYRRTLASLDEEPGGWRRCALAFLEAKALRAELGNIRFAADAQQAPTKERQAGPSRRWSWHQLPALMAIAASFLIAFSLGIVAPRFFSLWRQEPSLAGNLETESSPVKGARGGEAPYRSPRRIGDLTLVMDGPAGETTRAGQVPVYEVGQNLEEFLSADRPGLGPELIELLRQQGYEVEHEEQLFPAALDDGRQMIVPVDGYKITPVGRRY